MLVFATVQSSADVPSVRSPAGRGLSTAAYVPVRLDLAINLTANTRLRREAGREHRVAWYSFYCRRQPLLSLIMIQH